MRVCLLILMGCGTGRQTVEVPVRFEPAASALSLPDGVEVRLSEARWPVFDLRMESPASVAWLRWPSLLPTAHAHPGHDFSGGVAGELLGEWRLDLLGPAQSLGVARLLDGPYATARLHLIDDPPLVLEGEVERDGVTVRFVFELAHASEITGITFETTVDPEAPPDAIVLRVDLTHALSFIDWRTEPGADGLLTLDDGAVENTLAFGVLSAPTWNLSIEE